MKRLDAVARELIRISVGKVYDKYFEGANVGQISPNPGRSATSAQVILCR